MILFGVWFLSVLSRLSCECIGWLLIVLTMLLQIMPLKVLRLAGCRFVVVVLSLWAMLSISRLCMLSCREVLCEKWLLALTLSAGCMTCLLWTSRGMMWPMTLIGIVKLTLVEVLSGSQTVAPTLTSWLVELTSGLFEPFGPTVVLARIRPPTAGLLGLETEWLSVETTFAASAWLSLKGPLTVQIPRLIPRPVSLLRGIGGGRSLLSDSVSIVRLRLGSVLTMWVLPMCLLLSVMCMWLVLEMMRKPAIMRLCLLYRTLEFDLCLIL